mmetsp:Transcript_21464/g.38080  ORF Transcript_21464/g.38080 Transcript_21464/m.38080 type:complete len:477 (-) Transcript_21464:325-1755(-)|eukprot:CAMPEP_0197525724 /NCGR_PEP_ID=MMETSP1318-20131121/14056_1 /TAXON_ID=552666 /ORGANISM="Partenskyella glossopodia, Strain RCC365" /LENGTH=476 /DNA_ID=CAMNT_0043079417 /DNA_START=120 /DNA_END=1550 /DNA_ORIENTATION=+
MYGSLQERKRSKETNESSRKVESGGGFTSACAGGVESEYDTDSVASLLKRLKLEVYLDEFEKNGISSLSMIETHHWGVFKCIGEATGMKLGETLLLYQAMKERHYKAEQTVRDNAFLVALSKKGDRASSLGFEKFRVREEREARTCKTCRIWWKVFKCRNLFLPVENSGMFRRRVVLTKNVDMLREHLKGVYDRRMIVYSLILGSLFGLWQLFPDEDVHDMEILLWEAFLALCSAMSLGVVIMFGMFDIMISIVDDANLKGFVLCMDPAWSFTDGMSTTVSYGLFFNIVLLAHVRLRGLLPEYGNVPQILFLCICTTLLFCVMYLKNYIAVMMVHAVLPDMAGGHFDDQDERMVETILTEELVDRILDSNRIQSKAKFRTHVLEESKSRFASMRNVLSRPTSSALAATAGRQTTQSLPRQHIPPSSLSFDSVGFREASETAAAAAAATVDGLDGKISVRLPHLAQSSSSVKSLPSS